MESSPTTKTWGNSWWANLSFTSSSRCLFVWRETGTTLGLSLSAGKQRLWVRVRDRHRDHPQAGEVHVWQPRERRPQLCYAGGAGDPAAGKDLLALAAAREQISPISLTDVFVLPSGRRELLPWSSKVSTTLERPLAQGKLWAVRLLSDTTDECWLIQILTYRRGSPLLMGVRSDHKLSTDHIPVLYRSCKFKSLFLVSFVPLQLHKIKLSPPPHQLLKTRRAAAPYPGQSRTPACSLWKRKLWSTTLLRMRGEEVPASFHPPFTALLLTPSPAAYISALAVKCISPPSVSSQQRSDRAHEPCDLPGGRWRGRRGWWPAVHPQDKAQGRRLPSPRHPDPADGAAADHEGWAEA